MILSKPKTTQIHRYINPAHYQQYKTLGLAKPRKGNQKHQHFTRRQRRDIPFVNNVKEVEDPDKALSLFHDYLQNGFRHDYPSYSALVYKLARSRRFEAVETVLGYLQDFNVRCRDTLFIALFEHYGKVGLVAKAIRLFNEMTGFNCIRTLQSFNALLNVLVDNDRLFDAKQLFDRSSEMGFRLNSVPFNILIKGWLKKGEWYQAGKVFDEMLERKVEPSVVTYNSLIGYLCRNGELGKAKGLFKDMIKKGKRPNAVTYALLMEGLCSMGEYKEAKKMLFDMEYRGCKPKNLNFGVLMNDLGKKGKIEEAKLLLLEMKKRRFRPDVVIYNILINHLCKEGKVAEAYKTLFEMQIGGCEANAATYRMLADGFCQVGEFEEGLKVLNAMLEMEKRKMALDSDGWEALVRCCCSEHRGAGSVLLCESLIRHNLVVASLNTGRGPAPGSCFWEEMD
ncbi:pentatricopeptide repeat-containing protein At1g07740, mitochondrial isoform X2 [Ricinus communis]|uniref:pentatricopeptide repeat-containing protein At1g07740, mitochondrial isoform X2 n=1 Tax=Ricinus communis TaxID=3988 RepID=UPI00077298FB|nr:pentatricopeptide repeat-containing protein At1g07740, mitochondrial isoform X2 [Ricinus communis]